MISNMERHYKLLDLFRLACAFMVVLIHMGFGEDVAIIPCITRQAVPFFFLTSGFFISKRDWKSNDSICYAIKHSFSILVIYFVWIALWLPNIIGSIGETYGESSVLFKVLVLIRRIFLAGIAPYWYLLVLAEGILILAFVFHSNKFWIGWILCIGGITLNLLYGLGLDAGIGWYVHHVFYTVFSWSNNVVMIGFPLLFLGAFFSKQEMILQTWKRSVIIMLYCIVTLAAFIVYSYNKKLFGIPFGLMQGILLFLIGIVHNRIDNHIPIYICQVSRNLSSVFSKCGRLRYRVFAC